MKLKELSPIEASLMKEASGYKISSVLVALSGGADSVAAAYAIKKAGLKVKALHCNFHLRGEESDRDMEFVRYFCHEHDIPLEVIEFDTIQYIHAHKGESIEIACRNLRHKWFDEQLSLSGYDRIVTGHNADDNIETFFLNAFRGSGTRGLRGMIKDNGRIWRPLLNFHRKEILDYLESNRLNYVVDSTNLLSDYKRNFLRNEIIPKLRDEWEGLDTALDKTIQNVGAENELVEAMVKETLKDSESSDSETLADSVILAFPAPLLLVQRFIDPLGPYKSTAQEVLSAIRAAKPHIRSWKLRNGELILRNHKLFRRFSKS